MNDVNYVTISISKYIGLTSEMNGVKYNMLQYQGQDHSGPKIYNVNYNNYVTIS